jgi:FixJ family two-component response regulator
MQALYRDSEITFPARPYFNPAPSLAFNHSEAEVDRDVIYLVDDDWQFRQEISAFLSALGMKVVSFPSAIEYLAFKRRDTAACVILNTHLPDISGLELQRQLAAEANPPVIFVSDQCDIRSTVHAMKAGAIEFLTKPVDLATLIAAVKAALAQDRKLRQRKAELDKLQTRLALLTPREREVLPLIVGGLLNKQAASVLGISEVTLQIHRGQVMRKMQAESFAELVRMAVKLRIPYWRDGQQSPERPKERPIFMVRNGSRGLSPTAVQ